MATASHMPNGFGNMAIHWLENLYNHEASQTKEHVRLKDVTARQGRSRCALCTMGVYLYSAIRSTLVSLGVVGRIDAMQKGKCARLKLVTTWRQRWGGVPSTTCVTTSTAIRMSANENLRLNALLKGAPEHRLRGAGAPTITNAGVTTAIRSASQHRKHDGSLAPGRTHEGTCSSTGRSTRMLGVMARWQSMWLLWRKQSVVRFVQAKRFTTRTAFVMTTGPKTWSCGHRLMLRGSECRTLSPLQKVSWSNTGMIRQVTVSW